jgi:3-methylcrotonyl-CoA carboxylase alpha subunit
MFESVLIANRGEIACRVIRTARRLGVRTIAVYSDADAYALHMRVADEAIRVGRASARESYLDVDAILEAARRSGAEAIHPGYGFLSENSDFAAACAAAGFVFVGPPPDAIRAMGSKIGAKQLMERAGVPIVPGYHGDMQDDATLARAAHEVGYPLLIKASAGGGGKGMRIVRTAEELPAALAGARREASKAFGDDRLLLERYLVEPRHIEMQVFADRHGQCIHLNERDCSIQRRHQKIIEEAPAPGMSSERRAAMGEAAVRAARSVGYVGAGTVEFIASGDDFYFMEMNTRLQVEHPVTEMITGIDLVEWQLRIAAGESLPIAQQDVPLRGHAFEARLYAEDPARDFVPSTGVIEHLRWPETDSAVRIDTGVTEGDEISIHYDPMIAKLIVWGADRSVALTQLQRSLARCEIVGVTTNLALLQRIAAHADFATARVHTGFIGEHEQDLLHASDAMRDRLLAVAIAGWLQRHQRDSRGSPWATTDGWRPNLPQRTELHFLDREKRLAVVATPVGEGWELTTDGRAVTVSARFDGDDRIDARVEGERIQASWLERPGSITAVVGGDTVRLAWDDHLRDGEAESHAGGLRSPMPGQVLQVLASAGQKVKRGQPLMIVEAMKMEHTIVAPSDGTVESIDYAPGDRVAEGAQLLRLNADAQ